MIFKKNAKRDMYLGFLKLTKFPYHALIERIVLSDILFNWSKSVSSITISAKEMF